MVTNVRFFQYNYYDTNGVPHLLERIRERERVSYFLNIANINKLCKTGARMYMQWIYQKYKLTYLVWQHKDLKWLTDEWSGVGHTRNQQGR